MWTCPQCGESIEDQFDSCWKCAATSPQPTPAAAHPHPWRRSFLLGVLFEVLLLLLWLALPKESGLRIEVHNFCLYSHYPFLIILGSFDLLALILIPLGMALVWAVLFRALSWLLGGLSQRLGISRPQKLLFAGSLGCLALAAVVWAMADSGSGTPRPFYPSPDLISVVESHTAFGFDLYHKLREQPGNVFFSPYGIATALSLLEAGARGQTGREIASALHLQPGQTNQHAAAAELARRLADLRRGQRILLSTANSLWCQRGDPFTSAFFELARGHCQATVEQVDFARDSEGARRDINRWIARNTGNRIQESVCAGQLTSDTSLVLGNAIYFKGRWASPFKRGATKDAPFYVTKDNSVSVPMMTKKANFKTAHVWEPDFMVQLLELPYYGQDLSMVVILPEARDGLAELESRMTPDNLHSWVAKLDASTSDETIVGLPRFKTQLNLDLATWLKALGVTNAFDARADFSGIDGRNNLYLSAAMHSAFVEVTEEGTEAAAITLHVATAKGGPQHFFADHPFVFLIRENATGSILFLGRVVDPTR